MEASVGHQRKFSFGEVTLDSAFPSGNLHRCEQSDGNYNLWIGNDPNTRQRTWFYFNIQGVPRKTLLSFTIKNMANQAKLYKDGMAPVFREEGSTWQRTKIPILPSSFVTTNEGFEFQFKHVVENAVKTYFAFSFPWTLGQWDTLASELEAGLSLRKEIYFHRTVLGYSLNHRPVELVTITAAGQGESMDLSEEGVFPKVNSPLEFPKKKGILISARVHPGEVPSSHIFNGFVKALSQVTEQSRALLQNCVIYLIPFINPDGVDMGLYRCNSQGLNLNRHYLEPTLNQHPQIFAISTLVTYLTQKSRLACCLDLHAHSGKKGCFIYGNSVANVKKQVDVCLFAKLMNLNSEDFDYDACNFTQTNMYQKDKGDDLSKEGAARVAFYNKTNLHTCWTMEVNYNTGRFRNQISKKTAADEKYNGNSLKKGVILDYFGEDNVPNVPPYTIDSYENMGRSVLESFVDYFELLPNSSRVNSSAYKNMRTLKLNVAVTTLRMIPFKFDQAARRVLQNLSQDDKVFDALNKLALLIFEGEDKPTKPISTIPRAPRIPKASVVSLKVAPRASNNSSSVQGTSQSLRNSSSKRASSSTKKQ